MIRRRKIAAAISAAAVASMLLTGVAAGVSSASAATKPSWCGPKKITMGLTDGFGGNNWRLVTTASARAEVAKCASVTKLLYADGQGNTTKAISDIKGMVAKGVKALVVFPDAGKAILPTLRAAYKAGVVTVPYRVDPGGTAGKDYTLWVGGDFVTDGKNWGTWTKKNFPNGASWVNAVRNGYNASLVRSAKGRQNCLTSVWEHN